MLADLVAAAAVVGAKLATVSTHCPPQHAGLGLPGARHTAADFLEQAYDGSGGLASRKQLLLAWRPAAMVAPASVTVVTVATVVAASTVRRAIALYNSPKISTSLWLV